MTYFLSVYNAVTARKTFASALHHRSRGTGDAAVLLVALSTDGKLSDTRDYLTSIATPWSRSTGGCCRDGPGGWSLAGRRFSPPRGGWPPPGCFFSHRRSLHARRGKRRR